MYDVLISAQHLFSFHSRQVGFISLARPSTLCSNLSALPPLQQPLFPFVSGRRQRGFSWLFARIWNKFTFIRVMGFHFQRLSQGTAEFRSRLVCRVAAAASVCKWLCTAQALLGYRLCYPYIAQTRAQILEGCLQIWRFLCQLQLPGLSFKLVKQMWLGQTFLSQKLDKHNNLKSKKRLIFCVF